MLERMSGGSVPDKPHIAHKPDGRLTYEHCLTRSGFEGPFTIQYHTAPPQAATLESYPHQHPPVQAAEVILGGRRHFPAAAETCDGDLHSARLPLVFNDDVVVSRVRPTQNCDEYFSNAGADTLLFIHQGCGTLISGFGRLKFAAEDYVFIPKGVVHRLELGAGAQDWLELELADGFRLPSAYVNSSGQLRMDAPYSHRDFKRSEFAGPIEEGIRTVVVKNAGKLAALQYSHSPLDVVGYDGCVYPFVLPVRAFQPKVAAVHLPPTTHSCFASRGVLICNFVPRPLDFHPEAVPCPYPHSSVDMDEVIFYAAGDFSSRLGVAPGSISFHPRGIPHGPHPGRYEQSVGKSHTEELAVMLDCSRPLFPTQTALDTEDPNYESSFTGSA